jgi:GT2 family glycosyltransferase
VNIESGSRLSVVVISWNTRELLRDCLASLAEHLSTVAHEVIVVDNASSDGSPEMVADAFPGVRLIWNKDNVGFGAANNQAMRVAHGRWFLLLNSDAQLIDGSVAELFEHVAGMREIGVAACRLMLPEGRVQATTYRFPSLRLILFEGLGLYKFVPRRAPDILLRGYWDHDSERDVDWVIGAFMLLPRDVFEQTDGFDERLFLYGEDREWCYRIRQRGWRIRFYPQATALHRRHASADIGLGDERQALCLQRDRDFYVEEFGRARAALMMAVLVAGGTLRVAYYTLRGALGGSRAGAYRAMQPELVVTLRLLLALALGRR